MPDELREEYGNSGFEAPAYHDQPRDVSSIPKEVKVKLGEQQLEIYWRDGGVSAFSLPLLRRHCPCASCRAERRNQSSNPLNVLKSDPDSVCALAAKLVGSYAIRFDFSDGHNTGIFDFRYLRELDALR